MNSSTLTPNEQFELDKTYYYLNPEKHDIVTLFNRELKIILAETTKISHESCISFYARLFEKNSSMLYEWATRIEKTHPIARYILFAALWQANTPAAHGLLDEMSKKPAYANDIRLVKTISLVDLKTVTINSAERLDSLWSAFFATGEPIYIQRLLMKAIEKDFSHIGDNQFVSENECIDFAIVAAAKWSVNSNLKQHSKVLEIATAFLSTLPRKEKAALTVLIEGATGIKSAMASYGFKLFDKDYYGLHLQEIIIELKRITGMDFRHKVTENCKKLTCWFESTNQEEMDEIYEHLQAKQIADEITLRHTRDEHHPIIIISQPKLSALNVVTPLERLIQKTPKAEKK